MPHPEPLGTKQELLLALLRGLPTRSDLRDLEDRLAERLTSLAGRLDRAFDN
jgi:hypothetical protein